MRRSLVCTLGLVGCFLSLDDEDLLCPSSHLCVEAESGTLTPTMITVDDANASGGRYVSSTESERGTVSWRLAVERDGGYVVWCRVLAPSCGVDSFYVSIDGADEQIYVTDHFMFVPGWAWTRINGNDDPRIFQLSAGTHTLSFRSREFGTGIDRLLVTSDLRFAPRD